jgi:hypothetical protein
MVRWVPHTLTSELRKKGVEFARQLLRVLEQKQRVSFHVVVTSDESCFM